MKPSVVLYGTGQFNQTFLTSALTLDLPMTVSVLSSTQEPEQVYEDVQTAASGCANAQVHLGIMTDFVTADALIIGDLVDLPRSASAEERLTATLPRLRELIQAAMAEGFKGKIIVASPDDGVLTYFAQKFSGVGANQCLGVGTLAHSCVLANTLARTFNVPTDSVHAYVVGVGQEHVVAWSRSTIGPVPILSLMANDAVEFNANQLGEIEQRLNQAIISANDGLRSQAVLRILRALFFDRPMVGSVTNLLTTVVDRIVPLSTPIRLTAMGASKIVDVSYTEIEQRQLDEITTTISAQITTIENGDFEPETDENDEH
ncbi:Rossmann-fold NAD(P)-binding domain-containing protein [Furfurilactobacillus curtus]|uniref:Lactate dehydrogenase n=1 Tax=Furfurilactobacillus curtus TaxID=1746200 RepID=A0ABQ5JNT0_9LACO